MIRGDGRFSRRLHRGLIAVVRPLWRSSMRAVEGRTSERTLERALDYYYWSWPRGFWF